MTGQVYKEVIRDVMLPYAAESMAPEWKVQHDNDPKHTSRVVKDFLRSENINVIDWPAQSLDLNPIENLWEDVDRSINRDRCSNLDLLWEQVQKAWYATPVEVCKKLVNSMDRRCADVLRNNGFPSKY